MHVARTTRRLTVVLSLAALLAGLMTAIGASVGTAAPSGTAQRYLVRVNNAADYGRVGLPQGWDTTTGAGVTVGVADTGLDYTHPELASKVVSVADFTRFEDPPLCKTFFGFGDRQLAKHLGGPMTTDWNGHGSW